MSENEKKKLLEIKDLKIYYPIKGKRDAEGKPAYVKAVDGVTFDVYENETFGLVGESRLRQIHNRAHGRPAEQAYGGQRHLRGA